MRLPRETLCPGRSCGSSGKGKQASDSGGGNATKLPLQSAAKVTPRYAQKEVRCYQNINTLFGQRGGDLVNSAQAAFVKHVLI